MNFLSLLLFLLKEGVIEQLIPLVPDRVEKLHEIVWNALARSTSQQEAVTLLCEVIADMLKEREQPESTTALDVTIAFASFLQTLVPALPPPPVVVEETELEEESEMLLTIIHGTRILRDRSATPQQRSLGYEQARANWENLGLWLRLIDAELTREEEHR